MVVGDDRGGRGHLEDTVTATRLRSLVLDVASAVTIADPGGLPEQIAPASQDAILIVHLAEESTAPDWARVFADCRAALRPGGVLCLAGADGLRESLAGSFEAVETFAWNGLERFDQPGAAGEPFALARAGAPYPATPLELREVRAAAVDTPEWIVARLAEDVTLPSRFLLRAELHVPAAPPDAVIHFVFHTAVRDRYFWIGLPASKLRSNPAHLMLASELAAAVGGARWEDVERIVMRIRSPAGGACDLRISDLRVVSASVLEPRFKPPARHRREPVELERGTVTSKLFDPRDYRRTTFAEIRKYFDSWWYVLAREKVKFSYFSPHQAWEYAQLITSAPFTRARVLDVGTAGSLAPIFLVRMLGCTVVTLDRAWEQERRVLYDAAGIADDVRVDVGELDQPFSYQDNSFDIVTCWSVIEHLGDYSAAVREMKRVCKDGGHICLTTDFAESSAASVKSGVTFDRSGLQGLIAAFGLPFSGEADYENVDLTDPDNLAVNGEYTFASIVLEN